MLVQGDNRSGLGHTTTQAIADGGINLAFLVTHVIGKKYAEREELARLRGELCRLPPARDQADVTAKQPDVESRIREAILRTGPPEPTA